MAKKIELNAFDLAQRFVGISEIPGAVSNPQILAMLRLDQDWPDDDEVPWCSAFMNYVAWLLRLPRSKSLRARSWLLIGSSVALENAEVGFDVVILTRGEGVQPGPNVIDAPGHVGLFAGTENTNVLLLGGNQNDSVNVSPYSTSRVLGVRRLLLWVVTN
jgi:uncharacterized protein (TIGR02594 family)